jgi:pimeloyl-ACP methyl ester carboxylesterase
MSTPPPAAKPRKLYLDTSRGQVHVRTLGEEGGRPLLLVHWTPASGRMWEAVAPHFARAGRRVIMPDLIGYGRSDARPHGWSMADWATSLIEVLDGLGVDVFDVLGGHNGASVATEIGIAAPERVGKTVLDGCAILTPELRAAFAQLISSPRPKPGDRGIERLAWDRAVGVLKEYRPGFVIDERTIEQVWPLMRDYLETDFVSSAPVAGNYDLAERLPMIAAPLLLMTATTDPLAGGTRTAMALRPEAPTHFFEGDHPVHEAHRAAEFARPVLDFLA